MHDLRTKTKENNSINHQRIHASNSQIVVVRNFTENSAEKLVRQSQRQSTNDHFEDGEISLDDIAMHDVSLPFQIKSLLTRL